MGNAYEDLASGIVALVLGVDVEIHDDGANPGMYDLRVGPRDQPDIAIEVTQAADRRFMQLVDAVAQPIEAPDSGWAWLIRVTTAFHRGKSEAALLRLLKECEERHAEDDFISDARFTMAKSDPFQRLGVVRISGVRVNDGGYVAFSPDTSGGVVDRDGALIGTWLEQFFLAAPDVVGKLGASGARERHAFIPVVANGAPWEIESFLAAFPMHDGRALPVPSSEPTLPSEITHVWLYFPGASQGWLWDGSTWCSFDARGATL